MDYKHMVIMGGGRCNVLAGNYLFKINKKQI